MSKDRKGDFDPRFNPAFQRGFGGDLQGSGDREPELYANEPTLVHPSAPSPARADSPMLPPPLAAGNGSAAGQQTDGDEQASPVASVSEFSEPAAAQEPAAGQLARNPFLLALAAIAVLLVAIGGWVFAQARAGFDDTANIRSQGDFLGLQAMIVAAPSIMLLGVATAIGVLFLLAIRWRGGRRREG